MQQVRTPITAIVAAVAGIPVAGWTACDVQSGSNTTALVELYTSEGCSSCPPADLQLARLRPGTTLVPLALHVRYWGDLSWDDLSWRDPYAQDGFARRQGWLAKRSDRCAVNRGPGS